MRAAAVQGTHRATCKKLPGTATGGAGRHLAYSIAFAAVCWYNYVKLRAMNADNAIKEGA